MDFTLKSLHWKFTLNHWTVGIMQMLHRTELPVRKKWTLCIIFMQSDAFFLHHKWKKTFNIPEAKVQHETIRLNLTFSIPADKFVFTFIGSITVNHLYIYSISNLLPSPNPTTHTRWCKSVSTQITTLASTHWIKVTRDTAHWQLPFCNTCSEQRTISKKEISFGVAINIYLQKISFFHLSPEDQTLRHDQHELNILTSNTYCNKSSLQHKTTLLNDNLPKKWLALRSSYIISLVHSPHMRAYACTRSDSSYGWPRGMLLPVYVSLRMHEQYASEWMWGDPRQLTLWTESRANLVWHLWRPWDNLHDTATDRSGDIDLKSASSKIRFLCFLIGPEACTYVVIWASGQWSKLWWRPLQLQWFLTRVNRTTQGPSGLTSCPLPPSILSPCDNRDIPELLPCLAAGLSLNSSGVCGMLDWRAEAARRPEANRREEMNNINKLRSVMAPGAWSTWMPTAGWTSTNACTQAHTLGLIHTEKQGEHLPYNVQIWSKPYPYVAL